MAAGRICSVQGCGKPHDSRGFCGSHYMRFRKYGDPLAGRPAWGEPREWLRKQINYQGDDCLVWPFSRLQSGYASVRIGGRLRTASNVMCELVNGPAPEGRWAVHSCGKGHEGCVNPRHLRWATPAENQADSVEHGTRVRGSRVALSKLAEDDITAIRAADISVRGTQRRLAKKYGVSEALISKMVNGSTWRWLK